MPADALTGIIRRLRGQLGDGPTDGDLLQCFARHRDEAAFAELVARHGRLVLGAALRHLPDRHTAEDVVQATFLALARSAARLGRPPSLVNWLYTVAVRQARSARRRFARAAARRARLSPRSAAADPLAEVSGRELITVIDDELARLPEVYRLPLVLCAVEGLSRDEAARRLGWPARSMKGRLERGRDLLRQRLTARGLTVPAALAGGLLAAPVDALPPPLAVAIVRAATALPPAGGATRALAVLLTAAVLSLGVGAAVWFDPPAVGPAAAAGQPDGPKPADPPRT